MTQPYITDVYLYTAQVVHEFLLSLSSIKLIDSRLLENFQFVFYEYSYYKHPCTYSLICVYKIFLFDTHVRIKSLSHWVCSVLADTTKSNSRCPTSSLLCDSIMWLFLYLAIWSEYLFLDDSSSAYHLVCLLARCIFSCKFSIQISGQCFCGDFSFFLF